MCRQCRSPPPAQALPWEAESWLQTFYVFFPLFFMPFPSFPEDLRHRMRAVTRVTPPDIISPPPPIILFRPQRDGTEELFTLPNANAILRRPNISKHVKSVCFPRVFETEVHNIITGSRLFKPGDRVAIGASGGKGGCVCTCFLAI